MGISINIAIALARVSKQLSHCKNGVMLGRQKMNFKNQSWVARLKAALNGMDIAVDDEASFFQPDGFCESYMKLIGWPKMESLDFTAMEGSEYVHDLSLPVPSSLCEKFDLIYDGGTIEHVFDIAQAYRNVDAMLKPGGIFISHSGGDGWFGHGFYQIGPDIPWRYWVASLGYAMIECCVFNRAAKAPHEQIPDPTSRPRGGEQNFDTSRILFYCVRRPREAHAPQPVVQSHYVKYPRG